MLTRTFSPSSGEAMTSVRVKGFKIYKDRTGKWRCYHRATSTPIKADIGTAAFFAECAKITKLVEVGSTPRPGTLGLLIREYRAHPDYLGLRSRTRADYARCFDYLQAIEDTPLSRFTPALVVKIRDKAGTKLGRKWGNYVKTTLSLLFSWAREHGYMDENPAFRLKGIKRPKDAPDANRPWSDSEREAVTSRLPGPMRLPIMLMMYCGIDPGDVVALPKTAIVDGRLDTKRRKTAVPVWVKLPQPVLDALAVQPPHDAITLCASSRGRPWTYSGLDSGWQKIRAQLAKERKIGPGLTLKGLRHTVGTILAEMGYDDRTIADMLGHETLNMARHYSRRANRAAKMEGVVTSFEAEIVRRKGGGKGTPVV